MRKMMTIVIVLILTIMAFAVTVPTSVKATTIIVPDHYPTIQQAINVASSGDTVYVRAGSYNEVVVINKQINLIGENTDTTIIDGGGNGDVVKITADLVKVDKFTIKNSGSTWGDAGIEINSSDNCKIEDCDSNNNYHGILLDSSSNYNSLSNNKVSKNIKGIWLDRSSSYNTISNNSVSDNIEGIVIDISCNNTVSNNIVFNNTGDGINLHEFSYYNTVSGNEISNNIIGIDLFWAVSNNLITQNQIYNNLYGIYIYNFSSNNMIFCNIVKNNIANGITLEGSDWNIVDNNTIINNDIGLKLNNAYHNTIQNNWFSGNNMGIYIDPSDDNIIRRNTIIVNKLGLAMDAASTGNIIYHNDFVNNDKMVCCYPDCGCGAPKNSFHSPDLREGNYWSDYTGADDGSGEGLYGEPRVTDDGVGDTETPHNYDWYPLVSSRSLTGPIDNYIQELSETAFKSRPEQRQNALHNKLGDVLELVETNEHQEAIDKLIHDIRVKMDGSVDGKANNDWITDPAAQEDLCEMIDELIANLGTL
jgi:parallel beta-helix repeat protein